MPDEERRAILEIPALVRLRATPGRAPTRFTPEVHDALLETLYGAGSDLVVLPVQDAFGMRDRINVPGTVGPENWSFRLPWTADDLSRESSLRARTETLGRLAARHGRLRA
jgi:4-alpha-glucanotransferase